MFCQKWVGIYVSFMLWKFEDNRLIHLGAIVIEMKVDVIILFAHTAHNE